MATLSSARKWFRISWWVVICMPPTAIISWILEWRDNGIVLNVAMGVSWPLVAMLWMILHRKILIRIGEW